VIGDVNEARETIVGIFRHFKTATQRKLVDMAANAGLANARKLLSNFNPDSIEMLLRE
jgi:hypothetical protein